MFYGPVWFVISLTFAIYLRAGSVIYQKRRQLRHLRGIESFDSEANPDLPMIKLDGIQVTSEIACSSPLRRSVSTSDARPTRSFTASSFSPYSVTIEGGPLDPMSMLQPFASTSASNSEPNAPPAPSPLRTEISLKPRSEGLDTYSQRRMTIEASPATWAYTKYAMLFFIALLVTWVCYANLGMILLLALLILFRSLLLQTEYMPSLFQMSSRSALIMRLALCCLSRAFGIVLFMFLYRGRRSRLCGLIYGIALAVYEYVI